MKTCLTLIACIASVFVLGMIDIVAGYEFGFFVFYYLPIAFAAWRLGAIAGCILSLLSAVAWCLADRYAGHSYTSTFYVYWNTGIRLVAFLIIAVALAKIRQLLWETRDELKSLRGYLRVCAWCRKLATPEGHWVPMEAYFAKQTHVTCTHGICPECARKLREPPITAKPEATEK